MFHSELCRQAVAVCCAGNMFLDVIGRWIAVAAFSDDWDIRQGHHTRASDWPEMLVHAEYDRIRFDIKMCWAVASQIHDDQTRALAFAMATHSRLGALSPATLLVGDIVRKVVQSQCLPALHVLYNNFLHRHKQSDLAASSHPFQTMIFAGVPAHTDMQGKSRLLARRLLRSELENRAAYAWGERAPVFFCRRGWFAGVVAEHTPVEASGDGVVVGVFEAIPHVFCDVWFPICRPFSVCMHMVHVTFLASLAQ